MRYRAGPMAAGLLVAAVNLFPLVLILKQAFTSERESLAWPPTWLPHHVTLDNFRTVSTTIELADGLRLSGLVAGLTVVSTLALVVPAAWAAARAPQIDRSSNAAIIVARLFPSIALAVPIAAFFVHLGLYNSPVGLGLWLAHTLLGLPVAFLILQTAFRDIPTELEEAALLDGATGARTFWYVSLPLVRSSLVAAAILVFLISWDEFGFALLLQVTNRSLPPLLYYLSTFGFPGLASAVAAIMLLPALLIIAVLEPAIRSGALTGSGR